MEEGTFYFKFSSLHQLYEERLQCLGVDKEMNRTQFKEQVLAYFHEHKSRVMANIRFSRNAEDDEASLGM